MILRIIVLIYTSCILFFSLAVVIRENFFNSVDTDEFNQYIITFHAMDIPYSTFPLISILFILRFFLTFSFPFVVHLYLLVPFVSPRATCRRDESSDKFSLSLALAILLVKWGWTILLWICLLICWKAEVMKLSFFLSSL